MTTITLPRALIEQALEALRAMNPYPASKEDQRASALAALLAVLAQPDPQDPELSAALGWPGGISDPVLDRKTLLQQVAALVAAAEREACAALLEANGMRCGEESLSRLILETNAAAIRARTP